MQLTFRIDDITPTMNWDFFNQTLEMLQRYNVKPILGIIPLCKDEKLLEYPENPRFWEEMKELQDKGYVIAIHGYEHRYVTDDAGIFPVNNYSEFAGLPYEEQFEKIKKGKQILNEYGLHTDMFMAPGHSFDINTCKALLANDIHYVTDGFGKTSYKRYGIMFLPIALTWRRVLQLKHWKTCTIVLHTNSMTNNMLEKYERICRKYRKRLFSWNYEVISRMEIGNFNLRFQKKEFAIYRLLSRISKIKRLFVIKQIKSKLS